MHQRLTGLLVRPSVFSTVMILTLSVFVLGAANWSDVAETFFFYDYFYGTDGLVTQLQNTENGGSAVSDAVFGSSAFYNIGVLAIAAAAGALVYGVLQLLEKMKARTPEGVARSAMRWERNKRLRARGAVTVIWIVYTHISLKLILPFCILASQVGINALWALPGWLYLFFALALFYAAAHLHVILMRLFVLRPRVFGGQTAILEEESRHYYAGQ